MLHFEITAAARDGGRCGLLTTAHGRVRTPAFMPVGTYGAVKGLTPAQLREAGVEMLLCNSYHLALRPGSKTISKLGGLHRFMGWSGPILTDSGGYQLFSLASSVRIDEAGAAFRSHLDGSRFDLTPERAVEIQRDLGVDIGMMLDALTGDVGDREVVRLASARTLRWARRTRTALDGLDDRTEFFGIMQGGLHEDLRRENADALVEIGFPGYAVGGLSIGEEHGATMEIAHASVAMLPAECPRYMMGMGTPKDIVELAGAGYDLFDCVIPTRNGRNGTVFTRDGTLSIRNAVHALDERPIEEGCGCYTCATVPRAYLHHVAKRGEMASAILASLHNVHFYQQLLVDVRAALATDRYEAFARAFNARYEGGTP